MHTFNFNIKPLSKIIFEDMSQSTPELRNQLEAIENSYIKRMVDALNKGDLGLYYNNSVLYKQLYSMFSDLQLGNITSENALNQIEKIINTQLARIIGGNMGRACQIFLCALPQMFFMPYVILWLPLLTNPVIIITMSIISGLFIILGLAGIIDACMKFESTTAVHAEKEQYKEAISFFKPKANLISNNTETEPDPDMLFCGS